MSNFKHSHILRLLGVCLDNDPHYIIMELMEGGDLLSYLRTKRSSLVSFILLFTIYVAHTAALRGLGAEAPAIITN